MEYDADAMAAFLSNINDDDDDNLATLVLVPDAFTVELFDDTYQDDIRSTLEKAAAARSLAPTTLDIAVFTQYDANKKKHSVLQLEIGSKEVHDVFGNANFTFRNSEYSIKPLTDWVATIGCIINHGDEIAVNFGPFHRKIDDTTLDKYSPLLTMYGKRC